MQRREGLGGVDDFKSKYSARELAREWTRLGMEGRGSRVYHQKVIRDLAKIDIRQHPGENGKGLWFWTREIKKKAPHLFERWIDKCHEAEMAKIARGAA